MFLTDTQIKELRFFRPDYELKANTMKLHIAKKYEEGQTDFNVAKYYEGGFIGGFDYPAHITFWSKEEVDLKRVPNSDCDHDIIGVLFGSQDFASRGIMVFPGFIHPGWQGHLIMHAICLSGKKKIEKNATLAYVAFAKTDGKVESLYDSATWLR